MKCFRFDPFRALQGQRQPITFISQVRFFRSALPSTDSSEDLRLLNKSLYDKSLKCNRLGWYARRNKLPSDRNDDRKDPMKDFLIRQGMWFERYVYAHKFGYHLPHTNEKSKDKSDLSLSSPPNHLAIVHEDSPIEAAAATEILMNFNSTENPTDIILQPTFLCGNRVARADAAVRIKNTPAAVESGDESWEILEIKSSTEKSFRKKVPDLAYTVSLARLAGHNVSKAHLILVDPTYVRTNSSAYVEKENPAGQALLYKTIDCTKLVDDYIIKNQMDEGAIDIDEITSGERPPVEYKLACGKCELLGVECGPVSSVDIEDNEASRVLPLKHGIWEIPRLSQKQFPDVLERALPTLELQDLELEADETSLDLLTKNQFKFFHAVVTNAVVVDRKELGKRLQDIANSGPHVMYLDFEAVSILQPPYPGMVPYETMITQYSLHKLRQSSGDTKNIEQVLSHFEYLSDPQKDCRKDLLEQLLKDLGYDIAGSTHSGKSDCCRQGPILVYSAYEKTQLKKLANLFPEYSRFIFDVIERRLVDLEKIIKDCVSHPEFCGRSSIKVTLPALVPGFEQAYQNLKSAHSGGESNGIADGGSASAAFADLTSGARHEALEVERTRTALLEYCKLDTLALVEIHKALWKLIDERSFTSEIETDNLDPRTIRIESL